LLPDGRDILNLIATGDVNELGFPIWFELCQAYQRAGDLVWTTAWMKLASQWFVDLLTAIGVTGFHTSEPDLRSKTGAATRGFLGLGVNSSSDETDVRNQYPVPSFSFLARPALSTRSSPLMSPTSRFGPGGETKPRPPRMGHDSRTDRGRCAYRRL